MMFDEDEEEPKDWEIEEENPPERLQRKWDQEEMEGRRVVTCSRCQKLVPADSLTCIFCGAGVFRDSGLLGKMVKWFKQFFS